jgi:hypothetical protein
MESSNLMYVMYEWRQEGVSGQHAWGHKTRTASHARSKGEFPRAAPLRLGHLRMKEATRTKPTTWTAD